MTHTTNTLNGLKSREEQMLFLKFCSNATSETKRRGECIPVKNEMGILLKWFNFQPVQGYGKAVNEIVVRRRQQK